MSEEENQAEGSEKNASEAVDSKQETGESSEMQATDTSNQISGSGQTDTAEIIAKSISGKDVNIDALLKVPVSLAIEVGRTKLNLNELLGTREGSVIELDRHLDEPLDILVNGALIAHGVVVLANEKFGLQITDIISLEERARSL
ncbi:MAG: flagellar motor switch protein FliN [Pseudohongiella sp.]|nr:MAG: flagellar motor switch protein FliN [Pseudohongiella sp.]